MEQRSEEWFKARVGVITGSRVGAILGVNPYQKADDVLRDMVREHFGAEKEFTGNAATNHGERMEPVALAFYQSHTGNVVEETGLVKHDKHEFLGASPDGLIGIDGGLEIKCPYWAKRPYSVYEKPSYFAQCQHVMEVCDIEWMDFLCYIDDEQYLLERLPRDRDWFKEALPKLEAFHKRYIATISSESESAAHLDSGVRHVSDMRSERMSDLFLQIKEAEQAIAPLKEEFETLKKDLGKEYGTFQTGRVKLTRIEKRGSVDHSAVYKAIGAEGLLAAQGKVIDDFRKDAIVSFTVVPIED